MSTSDVPDVPGFVLTAGVDVVRDSEGLTCWPAVEEGTRRRVILLPIPTMSPAQRETVSVMLARFADVDEHLAEPVFLAERGDALVVPAAEYRTLDRLMPAVRPATAGQVVTVVAPVAEAVAALAEAGLAHGGVDEHVISIDTDGRPRLMRAGVLSVMHALGQGEVAEPTPQADREALLALLSRLAGEVDDERLDTLVTDLAAENAGPDAVAERLLAHLEPVALGQQEDDRERRGRAEHAGSSTPAASATPGSRPGRSRRTPRRGPAPRSVLLAVAVVAAVAGGLAWLAMSGDDDAAVAGGAPANLPTPAEPNPASPVTSDSGAAASVGLVGEETDSTLGTDLCGAPGPPPDSLPELADSWADVVEELNTRRSAALVTGQTSLLCEVYDPLSPALVADLELEGAYTDRGVRPDSLVFVVEGAELVEQDGALLVLEITDRLEPYALLAKDGRVVAELPGIGSETWQARLVPDSTGTQWRFG